MAEDSPPWRVGFARLRRTRRYRRCTMPSAPLRVRWKRRVDLATGLEPGCTRRHTCPKPRSSGSGPLAVLSAGAAALARATDLDTALAVIVEAGAAAVEASMAAVFGLDPDRGDPGAPADPGHGRGDDRRLRARRHGRPVAPDPPRGTGPHRGARPRGPDARRGGDEGSRTCRSWWPAVTARRTASAWSRSAGPGSHHVSTAEETVLVGDRRPRRGGDQRLPDRLDGVRAGGLARADLPHGCADGPRERAHSRPRPGAGGGPGATAGHRGLRRGLRHRWLHRAERRRGLARRGPGAAAGGCDPRGERPPGRHDRPHGRRRVRARRSRARQG